MKTDSASLLSTPGQRLLSLDFLRGFIMIVLVLGETGIFRRLDMAIRNSFTQFLSIMFIHSKWHGLHFWDLLLPAFMSIAGVSMALSYHKQQQLSYSRRKIFLKVIRRCFLLLFWGVMIYAVRGEKLNLQFSNVLTELSFATFISFLIIRSPVMWQLSISLLCLLIPELLLRFVDIPGFDQPFTDQHNFANYLDLIIIHKVNKGYGTTLNCLPSAALMIWGLMAGQLLLTNKNSNSKFIYIFGLGSLAFFLGTLLDWTGITPILKWIASSSFILVTGGISLIALAICYRIIDVCKNQRYLKFFTIMGMNSIFIYLFYNFVGAKWMNHFIDTLLIGLLNLAAVPITFGAILSSMVIFFLEWYLCYFLYKKKIFFKL